MTILFKSDDFPLINCLYQGKARKNLFKKRDAMKYVDILITSEGLELIGKKIDVKNSFGDRIKRDCEGYGLEIPWSKITSVRKLKEGFLHIISIETQEHEEPFKILSLDLNTSGLGIKDSKRNSEMLIERINKAKAQIESSERLSN